MKKIVSLISIIFVFAFMCAFVTGCNNNSDGDGTTTTESTAASAITSATTDTSVSARGTSATTLETTATTTKATTKATTAATTKATTTATTVTTATTATTAPVTPKNITIFLDPGHGGSDPGVVRTYGGVMYKEADINLTVALKAKAELEKRGYAVVMSRDTDKTVGLYDRAPLAEAAKADMFISIHVNAFSNENNPVPNSVAGPRMYYTHRTGLAYDAREFATYFAEEFDDIRDVTLSDNPDQLAYPNMKLSRVYSDKDLYGEGSYLAVLAAEEIPSVLIEMGFITNDNDLLMLKSQWWQNYVALAIADAVDRAS